MSRLRVKNFGPIMDGVKNDSFLEISKLSVFIGNQGTGKSTVAKLFSSFSWLEKSFFNQNNSFTFSSFIILLKFHRIDGYLKDDTEIEYVPTQWICEYCKIIGADGISFASSLDNNGLNYVIFNPSDAKCTKVLCRTIEEVNIKAK